MEEATAGRRAAGLLAIGVAAALQLVVGFFTFTAIGLISVPVWAIVLLGVLWTAAVVLLVRSARERPITAPLVPLANGLLLWAVVAVGGAWLGWNA